MTENPEISTLWSLYTKKKFDTWSRSNQYQFWQEFEKETFVYNDSYLGCGPLTYYDAPVMVWYLEYLVYGIQSQDLKNRLLSI